MDSSDRVRPGIDNLLVDGAGELGLRLSSAQVAAFAVYLEEITRWSARTNLTAFRRPQDIVRLGFLDSLACLPLVPPEAIRAIDIGSGAGFPGLPLKLVRPDLLFTLVEASRKKATFLQHVVRQLGLVGVRVARQRGETLASVPEEVGIYDLALARAVAAPSVQGRLVRPFLRVGGIFIVQIGPGSFGPEVVRRLTEMGFEAAHELLLPASLGGEGRRIVALRKTGQTLAGGFT